MKLERIKDINKFFEVVDSCVGTVELITAEGDRLNLKSKLSQFISLSNIFNQNGEIKSEIPGLELVAHDPADAQKLVTYMIEG